MQRHTEHGSASCAEMIGVRKEFLGPCVKLQASGRISAELRRGKGGEIEKEGGGEARRYIRKACCPSAWSLTGILSGGCRPLSLTVGSKPNPDVELPPSLLHCSPEPPQALQLRRPLGRLVGRQDKACLRSHTRGPLVWPHSCSLQTVICGTLKRSSAVHSSVW